MKLRGYASVEPLGLTDVRLVSVTRNLKHGAVSGCLLDRIKCLDPMRAAV